MPSNDEGTSPDDKSKSSEGRGTGRILEGKGSQTLPVNFAPPSTADQGGLPPADDAPSPEVSGPEDTGPLQAQPANDAPPSSDE